VKIETFYSHLNGWEWIQVHRPEVWAEIESTVGEVDADDFKTKVSKERGMQGKLLYAPKELNRRMRELLEADDWTERRFKYWVTDEYSLIRKTIDLPFDEQKAEIEAAGKEPIYSYNQTDFVKHRVAVEVQFGKYSFVAYDLFVKHLAFYIGNEIDVGVEILPMKSMQRHMSSGPPYYEGALYDLARQGRGSPPVPLVLVGVVP